MLQLGEVYKQLLGSTGQFAEDTLTASTQGLESGSAAGDIQYRATEAALALLDSQRDQLTDEIGNQLRGAAFDGDPINEQVAKAQLAQAQQLLRAAHRLASND